MTTHDPTDPFSGRDGAAEVPEAFLKACRHFLAAAEHLEAASRACRAFVGESPAAEAHDTVAAITARAYAGTARGQALAAGAVLAGPEADGSPGTAVRVARNAAGLSLRSAASKIGVSAPYLSDVELGRRPLTPALASKLAAIGIAAPPEGS